MKSANGERRIWIECAVLTGLSALLAVFMNRLFARYKPTNSPLEKARPEEKASAEPARRALDQATAQINSPEKANQVAERLVQLAGSAKTGDVEQAGQPEKPGTTSDKVADSSQRIEQAANSAPPGEKAADGIAQTAKEIVASPGHERAALAEATQETLNPEQQGAVGSLHPKQREYLRRAVIKRMRPFDALDAELFMAVNHLPHNRWLNDFFYFFTLIFTGGLGWYLLIAAAVLTDPRRGLRVARHAILPLTVASSMVEYPIKAFFHRRRPFIEIIQAIVFGHKPGSWSFPSGHSASVFAGAWLLSRDFPNLRPLNFLLAGLVAFSRIYLGDHYPGDVASGALLGITIAEASWQMERVGLRIAGNDINR